MSVSQISCWISYTEPGQEYQTRKTHAYKIAFKFNTNKITSLCSRQAIMISDKMTTPVLPTPALQCTRRGGLGDIGSAVLFV